MGVRPDLLNAEPGQRLMLLPPGAGMNRSRGRALAGLAGLVAILGLAVGAAALVGGGTDGQRASDDLPADQASLTVPASTATPATTQTTDTAARTTPSAATGSTTTPAETGTVPATETATETVPTDTTATTPTAAEIKAKRHQRAVRIRRERAARQRAAAAKRTVTVRVDAGARPTFLCVDDGAGHQLFGGTLTGRKTFKGKRVRLNVGLASTRITVNGNPVRLDGSPAGLDITRKGGARELPLGNRPCS
jgi:hypothetical protein